MLCTCIYICKDHAKTRCLSVPKMRRSDSAICPIKRRKKKGKGEGVKKRKERRLLVYPPSFTLFLRKSLKVKWDLDL